MYIIPMQPEHWPGVRSIFEEGIKTSIATFETEAPDWAFWNKEHFPHSRLVAMIGEEMAGWIALTPISSRCVYEGVAEISIYVKARFRGQGVGKRLLQEVIRESEKNRIWMLQASVIAANKASISLHQSVGFRVVGYREKLGHFKNTWHDVMLLEKRSRILFADK